MASAEETSPAVPGISGRNLTLWVLLSLVAIGVGISYTLWTYNRLDEARKQTASSWRTLTDQLAIRYRLAEEQLAAQVSKQALQSALNQEFKLAIDRFRTTSLPKEQNAAALDVEQLIRDGLAARLDRPPELESAVTEFNQSLARERVLLNSFGGRILDVFLNLSEPIAFELEPTASN